MTGVLLTGTVLLGVILPKNYSISQDIVEFGFMVTGHSIWFGYLEYFCSKDGLLFPVVGLPLAILIVVILALAWTILAWGLISEWMGTRKKLKQR